MNNENTNAAGGKAWSSDSSTVERRDRDAPNDTQDGAGISNRPLDEEVENQASVPDRGDTKDGAHAGRGHHNKPE